MSKMRKIDSIILHCSASRWGDSKAIDSWHKARNWVCIGYHWVILNSFRHSDMVAHPELDGKIEPGRAEQEQGAHCLAKGMNAHSIGVCLVGLPGWGDYPTKKQMDALMHVLAIKCKLYNIKPDHVYQHSDFDKGKPLCASLNMAKIRADLAGSNRSLVDDVQPAHN